MKYETCEKRTIRRAGLVALAVLMGVCLSTGCKK